MTEIAEGSRKILIQHGAYGLERLLALTAPVHEEYARCHGFDSWILSHDPDPLRAAEWEMLRLLLKALRTGYERIVWLAPDCLIVRPEIDLSDALSDPSGALLGMVRYEGYTNQTLRRNIPAGLDPGAIYIRVRSDQERKHLILVLEDTWLDWPEHFTNRRPMDGAINRMVQKSQIQVAKLAYEWNSTPELSAAHPIVRSWPWLSLGEQIAALTECLQIPQTGATRRTKESA